MIIGHLPAGYILSRLLLPRFEAFGASAKLFLAAGISGALAPDTDMLYFHLVDQRQHYHTYITHFPILWFALLFGTVTWLYLAKTKNNASLAVIFALNGFFHIFLDTIVGDK